jgi:cobalt/nickel transport system permease protein
VHIPDGFIAPSVYIPAYAVAVGLWAYGIRRVKEKLKEEAIPSLGVLTALAFALMMITIPLPGGTSIHVAGIGLLAVIFGVWISFVATSTVLLLQAMLFGVGGITSLPVNSLAMGLIGSAAAYYTFVLLRGLNERVALFVAGWLSLNVSAFIEAAALGLQPLVAHTQEGTPLFFPFDLSITIPAVVIPHAVIGVGEGVLTVLVYKVFMKIRQREE